MDMQNIGGVENGGAQGGSTEPEAPSQADVDKFSNAMAEDGASDVAAGESQVSSTEDTAAGGEENNGGDNNEEEMIPQETQPSE